MEAAGVHQARAKPACDPDPIANYGSVLNVIRTVEWLWQLNANGSLGAIMGE